MRTPEEISVAGCNGTQGQLLHPQLTTIREFPEQLGKQPVGMVLNRLAQPGLLPEDATIPTEILKRESCWPPKESQAGLARTGNEAPAAFHRA